MTARAGLCLLLFLCSAVAAHAGGPLGVCNNQPLKYAGTGTVTLNYDGGGTLGSRTKSQADAIVNSARALWSNAGTSSVVLNRGADLPVDVNSSNYTLYLGGNTYGDGLSPVVYDTNGSIIDSLLGSGQSAGVLGFAGSAWFDSPTCRYVEGRAVINGSIRISDSALAVTIAHELGHLIGLDHAQLDGTQGLASSNFPLMYPIAYRSVLSLHDDDLAAVSALYPDATLGSVYGQISGNFLNGGTPVRGANLWAREVNTSRVYSIVSDYLLQNTGYFRLLLPAGTYTLSAEAISADFEGGSSVGPYSDTYPDSPSFQAPLYVKGSPMAPVTLGGSSPVRFTISAGCSASASFNLTGSGSVSGNCAPAVPSSGTGTARTDLDDDGRSDILYRNPSTGQLSRLLMNGLSVTSAALVYAEGDTNWKVVGDGDFNGDGYADTVWRHAITGQVSILTFGTSGNPAEAIPVATEPNPAWRIVHTPDLNGDGSADLLWWNATTGQVYAMLMNGASIRTQGFVYTEPNTTWRIAAVGDFVGSGRQNQLVWRNATTGHVFLMTVNVSGGGFTQTGLMFYQEPNVAWKIIDAADFNGDGRSDILWRNQATGQVYAMLMSGTSIAAQGQMHQEPDVAWKVVAAGDYNGDGQADLLWRHDATGQVYMMIMNGLEIASQALVYQEQNLAWKILGAHEYNQ